MATTLVQVRNPRRVVYVGGLDDGVTEAALHAAFLPFGDIKDVSMPLDNATGRHRGFGFVEYEEADDAAEAVKNMDAGEFFGRTLRVNLAQGAGAVAGGAGGGGKGQPVWADADKYLDELEREQALARADEEAARRAAEGRREEETAAAERAERAVRAAAGAGAGAMEALEGRGGG